MCPEHVTEPPVRPSRDPNTEEPSMGDPCPRSDVSGGRGPLPVPGVRADAPLRFLLVLPRSRTLSRGGTRPSGPVGSLTVDVQVVESGPVTFGKGRGSSRDMTRLCKRNDNRLYEVV